MNYTEGKYEFELSYCLDENNKNSLFAVFTDGSERNHVFQDNDGHYYFNVRNTKNDSEEDPELKKSFSGRIKDAVEIVREGYGDVIIMQRTFSGQLIDVRYFCDREYGEFLRTKTINGWKNAKFRWIIKAGRKSSMTGFIPLSDDYVYGNLYTAKSFDSEEEAKLWMKKAHNEAMSYAEKLIGKRDYSTWCFVFDDIKKKCSGKNGWSFIFDLVNDMIKTIDGENVLKDQNDAFNIGYKIEQDVVPDVESII